MAATKVDFHIGPNTPTRYASFTNSSPTWGSAIARMGNAWAKSHAERQTAEADRAMASEQAQKRGAWAQAIGAGATVREIAQHDPSIIGDTSFLAFLDKSKPAPDAETFEIADNPYGRGGIGQRSSTSGKIIGYQGAPAPEGPAPETWETVQDPFGRGGVGQRSSTSGKITGYQGAAAQPQAPERRTAKDMHGRLRYLDDGSPAFTDSIFDQGTPPKTDAPPFKDQFQMVRQLSDDWQKTVRPMQGLLDQSDRMNIGLKMAEEGQMLAGSQAILISFNKLLDPTSVVRESEYARSVTGQSALETLKGYADRLARGGAGVTLGELRSYQRFGEEVVKRALESRVGPERERIERLVEYAGVDPQLIFTGRFAPEPPQAQGLPQAAAPALPQAAQTPGFAALAKALTGPRTPARAPAHAAAGYGSGARFVTPTTARHGLCHP